MSYVSLAQLVLLAAIWGASFPFMRVAVPSLGPAWLIEARVLLGALLLWAVTRALRRHAAPQPARVRPALVLGLLNTAVPFLCFAYAARHLPAGTLSILNSTSPIWGAVFTALWQRRSPGLRVALGLLLGVAGVVLLVGAAPATLHGGAVAASLAATACYGLASHYARTLSGGSALQQAHGSMWAAALWLLPALMLAPLPASPDAGVLGAVLALGLVCTGLAYLLYFRLVAEIGAAPALTVAFLIPLFGVLWGWLFLGEAVGWHTLAGGLVVLAGTVLVTGLRPSRLWLRAEGARG